MWGRNQVSVELNHAIHSLNFGQSSCFAIAPYHSVARYTIPSRPSKILRPKVLSWNTSNKFTVRSCIVQPSKPTSETVLRKAASVTRLKEDQISLLLRLSDLVLEANTKQNLTGIRTRDGILCKHVVDALTLIPLLDIEQPDKIIDVGTGAGFPGLVLAIARPQMSITLLDSVRKKVRFQEEAVGDLGLNNVNPVWARAEEAGQMEKFREQFDVAVARSVANMRVLGELTIPFVNVGGCVVAQKSVTTNRQEILDAKGCFRKVGGALERIDIIDKDEWSSSFIDDNVEDDSRQKALVIVRKEKSSAMKYPRLPGIPKKSPL